MTELVPTDAARYEEMAKVVELYVQNINETQIAKRLNLPRKRVLEHVEEWRDSAHAYEFMKDRVHELIQSMDEHYTVLIRKNYEIVDQCDISEQTAAILAQKNSALKSIAELERQRIDVLQKSGLLDAADQGDELARMEEEKEVLIDILKNDLCGACKPHVLSRLASLLKPDDKQVVVVSD